MFEGNLKFIFEAQKEFNKITITLLKAYAQ